MNCSLDLTPDFRAAFRPLFVWTLAHAPPQSNDLVAFVQGHDLVA